MTMFVLAAALAAGFWVMERTWVWLGEVRESRPQDPEEASAPS